MISVNRDIERRARWSRIRRADARRQQDHGEAASAVRQVDVSLLSNTDLPSKGT